MKVLVTGGAGFIGSALIRYLINNTDYSVVNIDKLTYAGSLSSLKEVSNSKRYSFEQVDICNQKNIKKVFLLHQPDAIIHLAAESHVDRSIDSPSDFIMTNIFGTYILLQESLNYYNSLSSKRKLQFRFHHVSTDEVYGDLPHPDSWVSNNSLPKFSEKNPYSPSSPYSASKASSDHLVRAWSRTFGLPILITNCSNNYGPFQFPEKLIPLFILNAINGKPLPLYGRGDQIRDWLYVDDHVKALITVLKNSNADESYNIGGNNEKSNLEVAITICKLLDTLAANKLKALNLNSFSDLITHIKDRPGHDRRYAIDANKITNELNWIPDESFESGIKKTVIWYLENLSWCYELQGMNTNKSLKTEID